MLIESKEPTSVAADPWTLYLYAMRSPATKEKYLMRLGKFLGFLNLQGTLEDKARFFAEKGKMIVYGLLTVYLSFCRLRKNGLIAKK